MKVVLDTNVLLQAIAHKSLLRPIWAAFLNQVFSLYFTSAILLEYEELLQQHTSDVVAQSVLFLLDKARNAHVISVY